MNFRKQLKKHNPKLYEINEFILNSKKIGFGEVELRIITHDYISTKIEMKAVKPKKGMTQKSMTKKVMIVPKKHDQKVV